VNIIGILGIFLVLAVVILIIKAVYKTNRSREEGSKDMVEANSKLSQHNSEQKETSSITIAEAIRRFILSLTNFVLEELKWETILNWFKAHQELKLSDADNIAFTLMQKPAGGNYITVQGIFNKRTNEVPNGVKYESKRIDEQLSVIHHNDELVVYE